uniref:Zgc:91849 n=1 Tax=Oryzias latipes TaxID=8090 RepID=A0A3P9L5A6_ORYLA
MGASLRALYGATLILLVRLSQLCEARVNTEIQVGPLYRVVDTRLSIFCNASGYPSDKRTEFQFCMSRPSRPDFSVNIISSEEPDFSYASHGRRVATKDIVLMHQGQNDVLFVIEKLLKEDEGEYECISVSKETVLDGTFSAKTIVKVIDDSLSVLLRDSSTSMSLKEGEALSLTCQASSDTLQHTHLSVVWFLQKKGAQDPQPIISLSRDFTLIPGGDFKQRYKEGAINLDKIGETTYRLEMTELQLSDQGQIYCQAQEWIQDPDRSWYSINQKDTEKIDLTVKAREVGPDVLSLVVKISSEKTLLLEGQELLVSCSVDTQNLKERFFSVAWFREDIELIRIGPTGILTVSLDDQRVEEGGLRAIRIGDGDYRFGLKPVSKDDQGSYNCVAWPEERGSDGVFSKGTPQNSNSLQITISVPESGLSVKMQNTTLNVNQLDKLMLVCKVGGAKDYLSVNWEFKSVSSSTFTTIISLESDGVMKKDATFKDRQVRATRPASDSFVFELDKVTLADSGQYKCHVVEKVPNQDLHTNASECAVTVIPLASLMEVSLRSRSISPTIGAEAVLMCKVKGPRIPITVSWIKKKNLDIDEIVKLNYNGDISWSANQESYQVSVRNQIDSVIYDLKLTSASQMEKGTYQCSVSTFVEGAHKKLATSNGLDVAVQNPGTKFKVDLNPTIEQMINSDLHMKCLFEGSILQYAYSVTWLLQRETGYRNIVSIDKNALVTYGNVPELNHRQRVSIKRTEGAFELVIRQAKLSDSGSYVCNVTEWLKDPRGSWISLSTLSMTTKVKISEPKTHLLIETRQLKELNISRDKDFTIPCHLTKQASNESQFQVTWFWQEDTESDMRKAIFTVYRNSTLQSSFEEVDLRFSHPGESIFSLTVLKPSPQHSGLYFCEVEEWLPSLPQEWRRVTTATSEKLNVTVTGEGEKEHTVMDPKVPFSVTVVVLLLIIVALVITICKSKGSGSKKQNHTLWAEQGQHIKLDAD